MGFRSVSIPISHLALKTKHTRRTNAELKWKNIEVTTKTHKHIAHKCAHSPALESSARISQRTVQRHAVP